MFFFGLAVAVFFVPGTLVPFVYFAFCSNVVPIFCGCVVIRTVLFVPGTHRCVIRTRYADTRFQVLDLLSSVVHVD